MKKILSFLLILNVIACSSSKSENVTKIENAPAPFDGTKKVHFAVIRQALEGETLQMWEEGAKRQADLLGIELTFFGRNMDNKAQADFVYQAINMKVDGIVLDHGLTETLEQPAKDALAAGIPVVAFEVELNNPEISQIAQDNYALSQYVLNAMYEDFNGKANIGYIFVSGELPLEKRDKAFSDFTNKYRDMREIARSGTLESPFSIKNADQVKAVLRANDNINAYFAPFDEFAKGVILALEENNATDKVKVYGIDITTQDIELMIKDGSPWVATASTNPKVMASLTIRALALKVAGENIPKEILVKPFLFRSEELREKSVRNMEMLEESFPEFIKSDQLFAEWIPKPY